jgi:hypothetical protein
VLLASSFKAAPSGTNSSPNAGENGVAVPAIAIQRVAPTVFHGDVRNLPQVPQHELERPELEPPVSYKNLLPEALTGQRAEPNIPLAPMPAPIQNFAGIKRSDTLQTRLPA